MPLSLWYLVTVALADWDSLQSCGNSPSVGHTGSVPLATPSAGGCFGLPCTLSCPRIHGTTAEAKLLAQGQNHSLTHCWPFPASADLWGSLQLSQPMLLSISLSISNYNGRPSEAWGFPLPILQPHMYPDSGGIMRIQGGCDWGCWAGGQPLAAAWLSGSINEPSTRVRFWNAGW